MPIGNIDVAVRQALGASPQKSPMSGKNPQLQPTEETRTPTADFGDFDAVTLHQAASNAIKEKKPETTSFFGKLWQGAKEAGQGVAAFGDVTLGGVIPAVAGGVTYAGARALQKSPEEAAALEKQVTESTSQPFGKAFGVTQTPGYQNEATNQAMNFIGQHMGKGASWIAKNTGLPIGDVQNMMGTITTAIAPEAGKAVGKELSYMGEAAKQGAKAVTAPLSDLTEQFKAKLPNVRIEKGPQSVGAAAVPDERTIQAAISQVSPELQQEIGKIPVNKVNVPVLQRHVEADTLPIPIRLTEGQATGDPVIISQEMNRRGVPGNEALVTRLSQQNEQLIDNLRELRGHVAPDVGASRPIELGQNIIDSYKEINDKLEKEIGGKYQALRDAAGGQFPIDAKQLLNNVDNKLKKELLSNEVPAGQYKELQRLANDNNMTFEDYLSLRRNLGDVARTSQDGQTRKAASFMIQELENLPLSKEAANLKPLADDARNAAKNRFKMLEIDPAMKAAVEDSVPADKFTQKFVVNGINKNIEKMIGHLGENSPAHQSMKASIIYHLADRAGVPDLTGNFTQAGYNKALIGLDKMNNLNTVMQGDAVPLKTLGNVAGYIQQQPKGSFVNNSNTLVGALANRAAGLLEGGANIVGGGKYGIPVGSIIRNEARKFKAGQETERSLKPGAGVEIKE
jgi:hypothetical protein